MPELCNLDGEILPLAQARVPVMDRGFLFGDSLYEVLATRRGVPFAWPEHLARLRHSAAGIDLRLDLDDATILRRVQATVAASGLTAAYVRIIVTRGAGTAPNIDLAFAPGPPCWVMLVRELPAIVGKPIQLAIVDRLRVDRRALDPAIKSGNYLNNVLALREARQLGATDCLMVNTAGFVTEASTSNMFVWRGERLLTPPLTAGILAGVTRALLLEFCRDQGIAAVEQDLTPAEVRTADEVFLTSTLKDIGPVTHLDGRPILGGESGPRTRQLLAAFSAHLDALAGNRYGPALSRLLGPGP